LIRPTLADQGIDKNLANRAREVLATTDCHSLRLIHEKHFRFTSAGKPPHLTRVGKTRNQPAGKTSNPVNEDKLERAQQSVMTAARSAGMQHGTVRNCGEVLEMLDQWSIPRRH
jgi:hypothetical protein